MSATARLDFWCPECGASISKLLNTSAMRKKGENSTDCRQCHASIEIGIDIVAEPHEPIVIARDKDGKPTGIYL